MGVGPAMEPGGLMRSATSANGAGQPESGARLSALPNRTLLWGAVALLVAALSQAAYSVLRPTMTWQYRVAYLPGALIPTLLLAALIVFAVGVRGGGSVVGESIVGRIALIGFGVCQAYAGWFDLLGIQLTEPPAYGLIVAAVLGPAFLIVSVIVIAWRGTLPGLWRFAPAIIVAALIARFWYVLTFSQDVLTFFSIDAAVILAQVLLGSLSLFLSHRVARLAASTRSK